MGARCSSVVRAFTHPPLSLLSLHPSLPLPLSLALCYVYNIDITIDKNVFQVSLKYKKKH